jgi:hypothetical protein
MKNLKQKNHPLLDGFLFTNRPDQLNQFAPRLKEVFYFSFHPEQ